MTKGDRMRGKLSLAGLLACVLLAACVQTTTRTSGMRPDASHTDAADSYYQLGARYYRQGSYELARDRLLKALEIDPRNGVAHYTLALTYEALGNQRLATESYEDAVRVAPRDYQVQNAYAVFLCKKGDFDAARKHFERAAGIAVNDTAWVTLTNAGVCMMQKPDHVAAEDFFRKALDRKTDYGEALLQMAVLMHTTGADLNARAFLQRYLSTNPDSAGILYLGVEIERQLGNERARKDFEDRVLREYPTSAEARRILDSD